MRFQHVLQTLAAAVAFTALFYLFQLLSGVTLGIIALLYILLANLLIVGVLACYILNSSYHSYRLLLATFTIYYVIGSFNIIIEAVLFGVVEMSFFFQSMLFSVPYMLVGSFFTILIFNRWTTGAKPTQRLLSRKPLNWVGKVLIANFMYIFFYLAAGILVQNLTPGFEEFYADKLPPIHVFFMTNVFFRGFVFVAIAILIDQSFIGSTLFKSLMVGITFSVIGGIAPLIPQNEFMPVFIRIAHGFEVGISNFLYGACVLLIVRSKEAQLEFKSA